MLIGNPVLIDIQPPELTLSGDGGAPAIFGAQNSEAVQDLQYLMIGGSAPLNIPPPELTLSGGGIAPAIFGVSFEYVPQIIPHIQLVMLKIQEIFEGYISPNAKLWFLNGEPIPIDILGSRPDEEPGVSYKRYHITIYPSNDVFSEEPRIGGRVNRFYRVGMAIFRKVPKRSKNRLFSYGVDVIAGVGIFEFSNVVMDILRNNTLGGLVNLIAGQQFDTPELQDVGENFLDRIDLTHQSSMLHTVDSDGVP